MTDAEFEVGRSYRSDVTAPSILIVSRDAEEIVCQIDGGVIESLEVMWCDLAKTECAELPEPWNKACYPVRFP